MVIEYPNVKLLWHNSKRGFCGLLEDIPDITKKKYGYNLEPGQEVYMGGIIRTATSTATMSQSKK